MFNLDRFMSNLGNISRKLKPPVIAFKEKVEDLGSEAVESSEVQVDKVEEVDPITEEVVETQLFVE